MAKQPDFSVDEHGQVRDRYDEWRSGNPVYEEPVFVWPPRPKEFGKWLLGWPGYLWPWNLVYVALTVIVYLYFTPDLESMRTFSADWIAFIFLRNVVLLSLVAGGLHLWLYRWRKQGRKFKYNGHWMKQDNSRFLFKDQVYDNVFWSVVSGCTVWSAYEVLLWWSYANGFMPYIDLQSNPFWFVAWMLLLPIWRLFHFYCIHMLFIGLHTGLNPAQGHSGFDEIVWGDRHSWKNAQIMHYMHHRYLTVNFGESVIPLDKWFGSFHNGTAEAEELFRRSKRKALD